MKPDCVLGQNIDKWDLSGNAGTTAVNFIGTTDAQSIRFRTNNTEKMILDTNGNLQMDNNTNNTAILNIGTF